jgi:HSP20 family protein
MRSLIKYNDLFPTIFRDREDDIFDSFLSLFHSSNDSVKVDIKELDDKLEVIASVPGFTKDNIGVKYEKGWLTISGEVKNEKEKKEEKYLYKEIGNSSFVRRFYLGDSIDAEKISAKFENGILNITLLKGEKEKFHKIEIS